MYSTENIIIQNGSIIPLGEDYNKYIFQDCADKWIMQDRTEIKVEDMSINHINNSIKMIDRICINEGINANHYQIYKMLCGELNKRLKGDVLK